MKMQDSLEVVNVPSHKRPSSPPQVLVTYPERNTVLFATTARVHACEKAALSTAAIVRQNGTTVVHEGLHLYYHFIGKGSQCLFQFFGALLFIRTVFIGFHCCFLRIRKRANPFEHAQRQSRNCCVQMAYFRQKI
jgi:hypothetical protein